MKKEIVIIGGGFAGVNLVKALKNEPNIHITLVDRNNYNFFPPLLYQVATGFLEVSNISYPFRRILRDQENANFHMGELEKILPLENKVVLSNAELNYDYLILATGTESNFFGNEHIMQNSLPMKTVNDALELRNFIFQKTEEAIVSTDPKEKEKLTTIVIAGGGPTGVEVAGMLAEMRMNIFEKDYPELKKYPLKIFLIDASETLLTPMSVKAQQYSKLSLEKMGVILKLNSLVKDFKDDIVVLEDGETIETKVLIWTAGVTSSIFEGLDVICYGSGRRLIVDEFNKVIETNNIYAIGDTCLQKFDPRFPNGHPQMAQVAIQQGKNLAKNLLNTLHNKSLIPFHYNDKGAMAIIGRSKAAADIPRPKLHVTGWFAWILWLFVHLFSLISYRNRVKTMYNWTTSYFTKDQILRMIIRPSVKRTNGKL